MTLFELLHISSVTYYISIAIIAIGWCAIYAFAKYKKRKAEEEILSSQLMMISNYVKRIL
jgi:hypothetical protein